ncbi:hypothetical protein WA026_023670 [Henosepilachna vigintioctopunctata]|uniref:Uncharacterized protein n=1 Tax=Henosepilachna vigintioctopunctata TaxID=420089 RepID=A0AAW1U809_9CUCU
MDKVSEETTMVEPKITENFNSWGKTALLKYKISVLQTEIQSKDVSTLEFNKKLNAHVANDNMKQNNANERVNTSRQKISDKTSTIYTGGSAATDNPSWSSLANSNIDARPLEVAQRSKMTELTIYHA